MAQTILTMAMITREGLRILENNLAFTKGVNRNYDDSFGISGAKIGDTINIRKPARYVGRTGRTLSIEDQTETSVPLTLDTQFGVDVQFTSKDLTLSLDDFSDRFLKPAIATIANKIDRDGLSLAQQIANAVGTPGTTPNTLLTYLNAGAKLDFMAAPRDGMRSVIIDPLAQAATVDALKGLFQSSDQIKDQYESGNMGKTGGFKFSMDQNVVNNTVGPLGGTPLVDAGGSVTGSSLQTKGWTAAAASRLKKGNIFTIGSVYAVNPQTRQTTGQLQQFVVTADFSSDGSGNGAVAISPAITVSGQSQNVDSTPADGAAITVLGAANNVSAMNLAYHRDAFVLGSADLELPGGVDKASRISDKKTGLSIRMVRAYDIVNDMFPCRLDVLYGWAALYPELACRVYG